jgi:hypothetical protein
MKPRTRLRTHGQALRTGSLTGKNTRGHFVLCVLTFSTVGQVHYSKLQCARWIADNCLESQLKAFADKHGIPVPQPRARDTVLQKLRSNYETVAQKVGETASYPGNWLYETWSESGKLIIPIQLHNSDNRQI